MNKVLHLFPLFFLLLSISSIAQCNLEETIVICDMTQVDNNNDGQPDGIINLYDEYFNLTGNTIQAGIWFDPDYHFALDELSGDLYLWDLDNSSEGINDYQFELTNTNCGSDIALTINIVIGPFSGVAVPAVNEFDVNVEICDPSGIDPCGESSYFDLYQALLSVPTAHENGTWTYIGNSPNFIGIVENRYLQVEIPYQPGVPLIDEETFDLTYTVPGIAPCMPEMVTSIRVSVVREVFSGAANEINLCESEVASGAYTDVDLRDDAFLVDEDIEGIWLYEDDATGQLTNYGDSVINLTEVYNDLYNTDQRFRCRTYEYTYFVDGRSAVCEDKSSTIKFRIFEELRPFSQVEPPPVFCCETQVGNLNLYDLLTFTTENGVLYDYPDSNCTNWTLVSGPSDLGLVTNSGGCDPSPGYTSLGSLNLNNISNSEAGTYTFRYTVLPSYNCEVNASNPEIIYDPPTGCTFTQNETHPCSAQTAEVTIILRATNYAGEDTVLDFCEPMPANPVDLFTLLNTNGTPVYQGPLGVWANLDTNQEIGNMFSVPDVDGQQTFNFEYSTSDGNGNCPDSATLSFTVYEAFDPGVGGAITVCDDDAPLDLFDSLTGSPDTNGTWIGPDGFTSNTNSALFDPQTSVVGDYTYAVPMNGPCPTSQAVISVSLVQNLSAGQDSMIAVCKSDLQVDLTTALNGADSGGTFVDIEGTNALSGSVLDVSILSPGSYNFEYQVQTPGCSLSTANVQVTVLQSPGPNAQDQTFCLTDLSTVSDLVVDTNQTYYWYDTADSTMSLMGSELLVDGEDYYVSQMDLDGCETTRTRIQVTLLPITNDNCSCEINDAISANGDGENDELDLCNYPEVFPNYEIKIFNRYGTVVFKGNKNTPLFNGESNVSPSLGNQLPSGVYFYVFDPKDGSTTPFQGNVYVSR